MPLSSHVKGIDVSHYQGKVDWSKVSSSDIKFAMAKATDGVSFIDPQFKANWSGTKAVSILRGATHYFRTNKDPVAQAKHYLSVVGTLDPTDFPPILDIEAFDGAYGSEDLVKNVQTWLDTVQQALKRTPIIYTGSAFWNKYMSDHFGAYPLWIAEYGVSEPKLPTGWSSWTFWQSTDKGNVLGIHSHVDMDVYRGTYAELLSFFQMPSITVPVWPETDVVIPSLPSGLNVKGVDVSYHQGKVDWSKASSSGINFAMAKATDGAGFLYIDPEFKTNWQGMKAANIVRGATHYYRTNKDPVAQANHFISVVGTLDPLDLPPVLDIDAYVGEYGRDGLVKNVQIWLDTVQQALKRKPIIYTVAEFWNKYMSDQFGDYPLWIAEYGVREPKLPIGWSSWTFWQNSYKGKVLGIQTYVDIDVYHGTLAELLTLSQIPSLSVPVWPKADTGMSFIMIDDRQPARNVILDANVPDDRQGISNGMPLFTGVGGQGCLYLALRGISNSCTLTFYVEVCADSISQETLNNDSVGYFCWTNIGWQQFELFKDETHNLSCSGIIEFHIPLPVFNKPSETILPLPSPIMPIQDIWLAITTERTGIKLSYINTQAIKLTRASVASLSTGEIPQISANAIKVTQPKVAKIASVEQPFSSFGGLASETKENYDQFNSFYRRVSGRLNHKDRVSSHTDYAVMAHEVCPNLFYAKTLTGARVGLVNGYASAQLPNAFTPVVDIEDQSSILQYIMVRMSAMAKPSVFNFEHQEVKIEVTVIVDAQADSKVLALALNQKLRLYLSPWICSDLPKINLDQGINRSELISFILAQDQVITVSALKVYLLDTPVVDDLVVNSVDSEDQFILVCEDPVLPRKVLSKEIESQGLPLEKLQVLKEQGQNMIFVSAMQHAIEVQRAISLQTAI